MDSIVRAVVQSLPVNVSNAPSPLCGTISGLEKEKCWCFNVIDMYIYTLLNVIGRAVRCGECAQGNFRYNCRDTSPGQLCDACNAGEYRVSCGTWTDEATCQPFQQCPSDHHLVGCGGFSAGSCLPCTVCAAHEYQERECPTAKIVNVQRAHSCHRVMVGIPSQSFLTKIP